MVISLSGQILLSQEDVNGSCCFSNQVDETSGSEWVFMSVLTVLHSSGVLGEIQMCEMH